MAGETIKTPGVGLGIHPWSRTSHVTSFLTPYGRILTVVKGAVRPKSAFLGQYDLNYTCELLYYARAKGDLHALRECSPLDRRDFLRGDFRALVLAEYYRFVCAQLAPECPEAEDWYNLLVASLDALEGASAADLPAQMLAFDRQALTLAGVWTEDSALDADRQISVLYTTNLELSVDNRRTVLKLICKPEQG